MILADIRLPAGEHPFKGFDFLLSNPSQTLGEDGPTSFNLSVLLASPTGFEPVLPP